MRFCLKISTRHSLPELKPLLGPEPGKVFVTGVDLGLTRDGSAVVTLLCVDNDGSASKITLADQQALASDRPAKRQTISRLRSTYST